MKEMRIDMLLEYSDSRMYLPKSFPPMFERRKFVFVREQYVIEKNPLSSIFSILRLVGLAR